ncbi:hypothetical protein GO755_37120 [Spirosoma sp. HMF4905]|uniref:Uncharacterized protein n=1 Tax=Spirosoma arboris TaxID=2682092 RepID=A0A7K1SQ29_9BACT|nr:hypothetical protein [Spirosoma arboris]MVM35696.1 hypothetical protein [Spirosoma arboris]
MNHLLKSQPERITHLVIVYQQLIRRTERAMLVMNQLEQRQKELREQLEAVKRQCDELQVKIDAEKARQKIG